MQFDRKIEIFLFSPSTGYLRISIIQKKRKSFPFTGRPREKQMLTVKKQKISVPLLAQRSFGRSMLKYSLFRDTINSSKQGGSEMAVSYKKLLHMLIDRDMSVAELQRQAGYSANISTRIRNEDYISLASVEKICRVMDCKIDDIVDFVPEKKTED